MPDTIMNFSVQGSYGFTLKKFSLYRLLIGCRIDQWESVSKRWDALDTLEVVKYFFRYINRMVSLTVVAVHRGTECGSERGIKRFVAVFLGQPWFFWIVYFSGSLSVPSKCFLVISSNTWTSKHINMIRD